MSEGIEQPKFVDGSLDSYCERLMFVIEAGSAEEAAAIQHLRLGWEPYRPMGKAAACPNCGSTFYPDGSGNAGAAITCADAAWCGRRHLRCDR